MPELGASRIYVGDEREKRVLDLLGRARLIILRAGVTKGFRWELAEVMATIRPARVLLILPVSRQAYQQFRRSAPPALGMLPDTQPIERLVAFDVEWRPVLFPNRHSLDETLRPFLERLDINPPKHSLIWKASW